MLSKPDPFAMIVQNDFRAEYRTIMAKYDFFRHCLRQIRDGGKIEDGVQN